MALKNQKLSTEIRNTPAFRAAFSRAVARYVAERMVTGEEFLFGFESGFAEFVAGQAVKFHLTFDITMVPNDTVFMPLLFEEARLEP